MRAGGQCPARVCTMRTRHYFVGLRVPAAAAAAAAAQLKRPRSASWTCRPPRPRNRAGCPPSTWASRATTGAVREWGCGPAWAASRPDGGRRRSTAGGPSAAAALCGGGGDRPRRRPRPPVRRPCPGTAGRPAASGAWTPRPRPRQPAGSTGPRRTARRPRLKRRYRHRRRRLTPCRPDKANSRRAARRTASGTPRSCPPRPAVPSPLRSDASTWSCGTKKRNEHRVSKTVFF